MFCELCPQPLGPVGYKNNRDPQVVVSALILFDPATGCYHYFTVTRDGAFHPAVPLNPVGSGIPSGVTACV